jgi:hypothetical protein
MLEDYLQLRNIAMNMQVLLPERLPQGLMDKEHLKKVGKYRVTFWLKYIIPYSGLQYIAIIYSFLLIHN